MSTHKVVFLGDMSTGKTSIMMRFIENEFKAKTHSTIGATFSIKTIMVDGKGYDLQIWDTAGHERFRSLAPMYYRNASAAILVFDVTDEASFDRVQYWADDLSKNGPEDVHVVVVANKIDLPQDMRVDREKAESYCKKKGLPYFETSAKTGEIFEKVFSSLGLLGGKR